MIFKMDTSSQLLLNMLEDSRKEEVAMENLISTFKVRNLMLKRYLHMLTDYTQGLTIDLPKDWDLDETNVALKMRIRAMLFDQGECDLEGKQIGNITDFVGQNLNFLIKFTIVFNQNLEKEATKFRRKIVESIPRYKKGGVDLSFPCSLPEPHAVESMSIGSESVIEGSLTRGVRSHDSVLPDSEPDDRVSRWLLNNFDNVSSLCQHTNKNISRNAERNLPSFSSSSKKTKQMLGKTETRYPEVTRLRMSDIYVIHLFQITISGLSWDLPNSSIVEYIKTFNGVDNIQFHGEVAVVQFEAMDHASKFYGKGKRHEIFGNTVEIGEIQLVEKHILYRSKNVT